MSDITLTPALTLISVGIGLVIVFTILRGRKVFSNSKACPKCYHEAPKRLKRPLLLKYLFIPLKYYSCNSCHHKYFVFGR